jgi:transcriptional regulator with XRE-family HTH domain
LNKRQPSPQLLAVVSYNVRRLREARGLTQRELSRVCKFSESYVGAVEQDTVNLTLSSLELLATGLECSVQDLFMPPTEPVQVRDSAETGVAAVASAS